MFISAFIPKTLAYINNKHLLRFFNTQIQNFIYYYRKVGHSEKKYIQYVIERLSFDNLDHISVKNYLEDIESKKQIDDELELLKRDINEEKDFIKNILEKNISEIDIDYGYESISNKDSKLNVGIYLLKKYSQYDRIYRNNFRNNKIKTVIYALKKVLNENHKLDIISNEFITQVTTTKYPYFLNFDIFSCLINNIKESSSFNPTTQLRLVLS